MARSLIIIDESKCDGCGICVSACHEGALDLIDGKAKLVREDYCDGIGDCIPACPRDAISFMDVDPEPIHIPMVNKAEAQCSCPSTGTLSISETADESELRQWPVKLRLLPGSSPYLNDADLLLIADCTAFASAKIHERFIKDRTIAICCPKFESDISERLMDILSNNNIKSLTVARMTVPCCSLDKAVEKAVEASGKKIPFKTFLIDKSGTVEEMR